LSIGYAVVSSVNLTISGSASGESRELKVYFDGAVDVSNSSKVTASASGKTGTASVSNLTLNETVTIKYLINNDEIDVDASVNVSYSVPTSYFDIKVTEGSSSDLAMSTFNTVDDEYQIQPVAVWAQNTNFTINAKSKKWVVVTVKLIKTPITEADSTFNFTIDLGATPVNVSA
jgi:hypothetical protein